MYNWWVGKRVGIYDKSLLKAARALILIIQIHTLFTYYSLKLFE